MIFAFFSCSRTRFELRNLLPYWNFQICSAPSFLTAGCS
ncbi:hypothetical protein SLEP1_g15125 [Rubroshorea leprosula]|uniref:Uncharacterized protein n=1 Tax=Rubroshorea leprosula TaxID=152421 RepID=A0AAV5IWU1_9ROSI|nr:hypothetical protein SLEP1_g15125 [Rubroshorea leprosula]